MSKALVEIGIPAHNEEANIARLLDSIFEQTQDIYQLSNVIVVSDGSSDRTVQKARQVKNSKLAVIEHVDQAGKPARTNEIFRRAQTDIVVLLDADVVLSSPETISALVRPIVEGNATLVSGRPAKTRTRTFTDHVMDVSLYLQDQVKQRLHNGQSVYACHGRVVALHWKIFSKLDLPPTSLGDDGYLYFYNKQHGDGFAYAGDARVFFKMPQSLRDFIKQQHRFSTTPAELAAVFGEETLADYQIPSRLSLQIILMAFIKHHVYAVGYLYYRLASKFSSLLAKGQTSWTASETTKQL